MLRFGSKGNSPGNKEGPQPIYKVIYAAQKTKGKCYKGYRIVDDACNHGKTRIYSRELNLKFGAVQICQATNNKAIMPVTR